MFLETGHFFGISNSPSRSCIWVTMRQTNSSSTGKSKHWLPEWHNLTPTTLHGKQYRCKNGNGTKSSKLHKHFGSFGDWGDVAANNVVKFDFNCLSLLVPNCSQPPNTQFKESYLMSMNDSRIGMAWETERGKDIGFHLFQAWNEHVWAEKHKCEEHSNLPSHTWTRMKDQRQETFHRAATWLRW